MGEGDTAEALQVTKGSHDRGSHGTSMRRRMRGI
jgi:hypothetical protein